MVYLTERTQEPHLPKLQDVSVIREDLRQSIFVEFSIDTQHL